MPVDRRGRISAAALRPRLPSFGRTPRTLRGTRSAGGRRTACGSCDMAIDPERVPALMRSSRRQFLKGTAGLTFCFALGTIGLSRAEQATAAGGLIRLNAYVNIA